MKSLYILFLTLAVSAVSCRTKNGEPGPAGGDALNKQGSISGTLRTTNSSGDSVVFPFQFNYYESLDENSYSEYKVSYYTFDFKRRDLKNSSNYFIMKGGPIIKMSTPTSLTVDFSLEELQSNNTYFSFTDQTCAASCVESVGFGPFTPTAVTPVIAYSNYSFDFATGRLFFNFKLSYPSANNSFGRPAIVQGNVDVILNQYTTL
jgi:hypothetical protein